MSNRKFNNRDGRYDDQYGAVSYQQWARENGYAVATPTPAQEAKMAGLLSEREAREVRLRDPEQWQVIKDAWNAAIATAQKQGLSGLAATGAAIRATGYSLGEMQLGKSIHG